jgi:hypothetical protein
VRLTREQALRLTERGQSMYIGISLLGLVLLIVLLIILL